MTRLYYPESLSLNRMVVLQNDHIHYLRNVLRQEVGAQVNLFNGREGEWQGEITSLTKSRGEVLLRHCLREPEVETPVTLIFCPIKNDPLHYLIEKCTEIGVTIFQPVLMERGNIHKINREKLQRIAVEASQQCERLSVPEVRDLRSLKETLDDWPQGAILYSCAERWRESNHQKHILGSSEDKTKVAGKGSSSTGESVFLKASLIGPEGGISPKEIELLCRYPFVQFISLGKNILRAETAAVVAATKMILG
ncbi:RsmE family RNA methyltransferase [Candidatus Odyssella acanthamoebae]|uniref:RsmE family RNA methyltransferase n=1 Tax=Candidatus Odyssella acanthamoebae TaxID=91604 RepID=UPI00068F5C91|nr:RsmE family RNA methyltransferase [Candidatus Paracaedibacter acanthamoebae]